MRVFKVLGRNLLITLFGVPLAFALLLLLIKMWDGMLFFFDIHLIRDYVVPFFRNLS